MNTAQPATIADEMTRRQEQDDPLADLAQRITKSTAWFGRLLPPADQGGMQPQAFAAQLLNLIRRNRQPAFRSALVNDPDSFLYAATDCAALNLKPGEEYWFVPFDDRQGKTGRHITGMPGWKGELQQIYRAGSVRAVKFGVVYQGDHWRWRPLEMQLPEYEPLAEDHDPSMLRRVYAYAEFHGGGISQVVVFTRYEVYRAKDKSKTPKDFWESEWEPEMWIKTALHRLYDYVPHSAAYNTNLLRAWAVAMERYPAIALGGGEIEEPAQLDPAAKAPATGGGPPAPPALPNGNGGPAQPPAQGEAGSGRPQEAAPDEGGWPAGATTHPPGVVAGQVVPPGEDDAAAAAADPGAVTPSTLGKLSRKFQDAGWSGDAYKERRRVVTGVLAIGTARVPPLDLESAGKMTERQGTIALAAFTALAEAAAQDGEALAARLQRVYDTTVKARAAAQAAAGGGADTTAGTGGAEAGQ
jgi:phage RecT family recombinase